jgi:hypothetical protein
MWSSLPIRYSQHHCILLAHLRHTPVSGSTSDAAAQRYMHWSGATVTPSMSPRGSSTMLSLPVYVLILAMRNTNRECSAVEGGVLFPIDWHEPPQRIPQKRSRYRNAGNVGQAHAPRATPAYAPSPVKSPKSAANLDLRIIAGIYTCAGGPQVRKPFPAMYVSEKRCC